MTCHYPSHSPSVHLAVAEQQQVEIARALFYKSRVLVMDEPTRGVDVGAKAEIYALIQQLLEKGMAVLFISSELLEVVGVCDRVLVMREGEITGEVGGQTGIEITPHCCATDRYPSTVRADFCLWRERSALRPGRCDECEPFVQRARAVGNRL